jgi:tight adherence protein C
MILAMVCGALAGLGVFALIDLLTPHPVAPGADLARIDAARRKAARETSLVADRRHQSESLRVRRLGDPVARWLTERGIDLGSLRADLALTGRSLEMHIGLSLLAGVGGLLVPGLLVALMATALGSSISTLPLLVSLLGAVVGLLLPTVRLRTEAAEKRRDFRHVLGAFLDLVSMNVSGGRGIPEALQSASSISNGWAMVRLRDTLEGARLQGVTPWAALGALGEELDVDELRDLAAALALVAEDGAKVRESLSARAASMRTRELAELEAHAEENSQSMLVAQLLLCLGFLAFLTYPALANVLGS